MKITIPFKRSSVAHNSCLGHESQWLLIITRVTVLLVMTSIITVLAGLLGCASATAPSKPPETAQLLNTEPSQEIEATNRTTGNTSSIEPTTGPEKGSPIEVGHYPEPSQEIEATNNTTENTPSIESAAGSENGSTIEIGPQVGKLAPDFKFTDSAGKNVSLHYLRGRLVVLNFWATWCGPCKYEMPIIQDLANDKEKAEKGLVLLTINSGESADTVLKFFEERSFSFPVLLDTKSNITRAYNIRTIPTTFFIGKDGLISEIKIGAFMNESELEDILNRLIE